jgi:uncharacterized membrane protein
MNLDLLPLGWVHFLASLVAIAVGVVVLVRPKGTAIHKAHGSIYVIVIVVTCLTALGIYRAGSFFFAHWFGVAALIITAVGVTAAHFKIPRVGWMHLHLTCMVASFYILIGGGVNEVFLRVNFFRRLVPNFNSPLVGLTHFSVMLLFAAIIGYFNVVALLRARAVRRTSLNPEVAQQSHS